MEIAAKSAKDAKLGGDTEQMADLLTAGLIMDHIYARHERSSPREFAVMAVGQGLEVEAVEAAKDSRGLVLVDEIEPDVFSEEQEARIELTPLTDSIASSKDLLSVATGYRLEVDGIDIDVVDELDDTQTRELLAGRQNEELVALAYSSRLSSRPELQADCIKTFVGNLGNYETWYGGNSGEEALSDLLRKSFDVRSDVVQQGLEDEFALIRKRRQTQSNYRINDQATPALDAAIIELWADGYEEVASKMLTAGSEAHTSEDSRSQGVLVFAAGFARVDEQSAAATLEQIDAHVQERRKALIARVDEARPRVESLTEGAQQLAGLYGANSVLRTADPERYFELMTTGLPKHRQDCISLKRNHEGSVMQKTDLKIEKIKITDLKPSVYNPRKWSEEKTEQLKESIQKFGLVDPILVNGAEKRKNIVIGGHFRLKVAKDLGYKEVPVTYLIIEDVKKEKELNIRLNKNLGDWDYELLAKFDESLLIDIGFESEDLDEIFDMKTDEPENFDLKKELDKLDIKKISVKKGDIYQLGESRLMCGDSTITEDFNKLMDGKKADMCLTDPPYILDYLHAKRGGKPVKGFGAKQNRIYLETESLPENFTELWMDNIQNHSKDDFSIIVYENWKNLRIIWSEMEKYWKVKNMIVWHLPNRHQGFAAKYKFFSKHDIAMVGAKGDVEYNHETETDGLQEEYETALYAISGKPQWEGYEGGKRYQPTDFIDYQASDEKSSGQGVIFGTKPLEILIPYIKVLTKRGDLVVEPFCGSGSTLIAANRLKRRCYIMEKSPVYAEVALKRWEKDTGKKRVLITQGNIKDEQEQTTE